MRKLEELLREGYRVEMQPTWEGNNLVFTVTVVSGGVAVSMGDNTSLAEALQKAWQFTPGREG